MIIVRRKVSFKSFLFRLPSFTGGLSSSSWR
jgi:hypothetical protein